MRTLDSHISHALNHYGSQLEQHFVTENEKQERAKEIAKLLSDNKIWHSHGRMIGINTLTEVLKLEIEDYTKDVPLRDTIRTYSELLSEYVDKQQVPVFMHSCRG